MPIASKKPLVKAVGSAPSAPAPTGSKVTLVTLLRGRVYVYRGLEFANTGDPHVLEDMIKLIDPTGERGLIADEIAEALDELTEISRDSEGEEFEKNLFMVERDQTRPEKRPSRNPANNRTRLPVRRPVPSSQYRER